MADATIVVGADASEVEKAAKKAKSAWDGFGEDLMSSIGRASTAVLRDLASVATAQGKVSFATQHQQVREFEASTAHLATATGQNLAYVRAEAEATGIAIGKRPGEVVAWSSEVGKLAYNFDGAEKSIRGFSALAAETGRGVEDYRDLASTVIQLGHAGNDSSTVLGSLAAQARALGNEGGLAAFADQVAALKDTISHFAVKGPEDFKKITALTGVLGKGLNPMAAARVQQTALGALSDTVTWERYLGHKITDEHGQVKDPTQALQEIVGKIKRSYGKDAERRLQIQFGAETGSALAHADFSQVEKLKNLTPSPELKAAQDALNKTDAGGRAVAEAELAKSSRDLLGSSTALGKAADALQRLAAAHPVISTTVVGVTSGVVSTFAGALGAAFMSKGLGGAGGELAGATVDKALSSSGPLGTLVKSLPLIGVGLAADKAADAAVRHVTVSKDLGLSYGDLADSENAGRIDEEKAKAAIATKMTDWVGERARAIGEANKAIAGTGLSADEKREGQRAAGSTLIANPALASGPQANFAAALVEALKKQGDSDVQAEKIAKAIAAELANTTIQVHNAADTPVTATTKSSSSHAAGHQQQG